MDEVAETIDNVDEVADSLDNVDEISDSIDNVDDYFADADARMGFDPNDYPDVDSPSSGRLRKVLGVAARIGLWTGVGIVAAGAVEQFGIANAMRIEHAGCQDLKSQINERVERLAGSLVDMNDIEGIELLCYNETNDNGEEVVVMEYECDPVVATQETCDSYSQEEAENLCISLDVAVKNQDYNNSCIESTANWDQEMTQGVVESIVEGTFDLIFGEFIAIIEGEHFIAELLMEAPICREENRQCMDDWARWGTGTF